MNKFGPCFDDVHNVPLAIDPWTNHHRPWLVLLANKIIIVFGLETGRMRMKRAWDNKHDYQ